MVDTIGPFATNPWSEDGWFDNMGPALPSGVHGSPAASSTSGDLPLALSGLNWTVGIGSAMVRGAGFDRSSAAGGTVTANTHGSWSRRDRIVLRRDRDAGTVTTVHIQGTAAASPTAPAVQKNDGGQWDLPLFSFLVPPASGTTLSGVVDEREWLSPVAIAGKMWKTSAPVALTGTPAKIAMGGSRVGAGITFDDANDELVLSAAGEYQLALHGYVSAGSGDGYFAVNRKRPGVSDLTVLFGDFTKPVGGDKRANATHLSLPLAAGDRLSLQGVGPTGVNALGTTEFQGCSLEVRYVSPLNGADPV